MMPSRKTAAYGVFWFAALLVLAVTYWMMCQSEKQFHLAIEQQRQCERLVLDIQTLQNRPGVAALVVDSARKITSRAEEALLRAGVDSTSLIRIEPQSAVRLRDSDYRVRTTRLQLADMTLEQLLKFTHAMTDASLGTSVRDLDLTAANRRANSDYKSKQELADYWNAQLVLTQLIFSPSGR